VITRANRLGFFAIAVVVTLFVRPLAAALGWAVILAAYLISLYLHPHYNCRACNGTGAHRGAVFGWGHRRCYRCGGQGRHRRWGTIVMSPTRQVRAEVRAGGASERRSKPL
jgi:hypothetical protein